MQVKVLLLSAVVFLMTISFCFAFPTSRHDMLLFKKFAEEYNKEYKNEEELLMRFKTFQKNLQTIQELNAKHPHARFAVNKFADWTEEEVAATRMPKTAGSAMAISCLASGVEAPEIYTAAPATFDWRSKGVVTPVKDQQQCGSCWTFSTSGAIESANAIKSGKLVSLSEQQMVDCSQGCCLVDGQSVCNAGCGGGFMWTAMNDIVGMGGLESESDYPYTAEDGTCVFDKTKVAVSITNYTCLSGPNDATEPNMASFLAANGPLSIALDASPLQFYTSGIIVPASDGSTCSTTQLDHAVLIIGYGTDTTAGDYWIVKNSWNVNWGEQGYFRIARGVGACGLNTAVVFPLV